MSSMELRGIALTLAWLGAAAAAPAQAQSCNVNGRNSSCNVTGNVTIQVGAATMVELPGSTISLSTPDLSAYQAGFQGTVGPTATVRANRSWRLYISASTGTGYWTPSGGAWANKPAGDLAWSLALPGPYASLLVWPASAQIGSGAGATAGTSISLFFQTALDWNLDKPGTYTLTVLYTLTAP